MSIFNKFSFFIASVLIILFFPTATFASETIKSFDINILAKKDGIMEITEDINYDFGDTSRHGIYRFIPTVSKVGDLYRVTKIDFEKVFRDGKNEKYEIDMSPKKAQIKIGDPDRTITGPHLYTIVYQVKNGIGSNYPDHDEIYWNVTGEEWNVPIEKTSVKIDTDFGVSPDKFRCFTGSGGSKEENCQANGNVISIIKPLNTFEGLTVVANFPVNTFPKSTLQKNPPDFDPDFLIFLKIYAFIWFVLNFLLTPYLLYWYFKHKSKVRFGPPSVNFDIPKVQKQVVIPAEAGIIDNTKLDRNDVVATIFDLATRKYLKIVEDKKVRRLLPDETDYKLIKLKDYDGPNKFEKDLMDRFFERGKEISLKDLKSDFYLTFETLEKDIFDSLIQKGFYTKNPKIQMTGFLILGIIGLLTLNFLLGPFLIFLSRKLNGRTQLGDKIDWQLDGLKIFLKSMSKREYKWQAENLITVEKYIPYAMAFGMIDEFMEQLKIVYPNYHPTWYIGSGNFYGNYSGIYGSFSTNITTSAPSSSSGFSGGSSGGGGGGGGGGSW